MIAVTFEAACPTCSTLTRWRAQASGPSPDRSPVSYEIDCGVCGPLPESDTRHAEQ